MEIVRIDPTPNPHTMKITLNEEKGDMKSATYKEAGDDAPEFINSILEIEDVTSVFHALDFISVDKSPRADWEQVIPQIEASFNESEDIKKN